MNRRDFFKAAMALLAAPSIPAAGMEYVWPRQWLTRADIAARFESIDAAQRAADHFIVIMHPRNYDDLVRELTPKEKWKLAYREARVQIKNMAYEFRRVGQVGSYENFRFVESLT